MSSRDNNQSAPDINTGYPGHIYNFDPATQTCEVQLAIENLFVGYASAYTLTPKQRLLDVPVQFIQGGGWSLTHPVPDKTPCYVHFAQRGIDHWVVGNKSEAGLRNGKPAPAFGQTFSHNAATCIIGIQPIPEAIEGFAGDVFEMRNKDRSQRVTLKGSGQIEIITGAAKIVVNKDSSVEIEATASAKVKAPAITLDGIVTVTKALIVQGGMSVSGGSTQLTVSGSMTMSGDLTVGGKKVNGHTHTYDGGNTGPF